MNIIAFGAHPDDCDIRAGGTAAKWAALGHRVRFVSVTNGDTGIRPRAAARSPRGGAPKPRGRQAHRRRGRRARQPRRRAAPTLEGARAIIRQIREWKADLVLARGRTTIIPITATPACCVKDAAFMVTVPNVARTRRRCGRIRCSCTTRTASRSRRRSSPTSPCRSTTPSRRSSTMLDAHVSQFYEWLPWLDGRFEDVPKDKAARADVAVEGALPAVSRRRCARRSRSIPARTAAAKVEARRGLRDLRIRRRPTPEDIKRLFPFLP